MNHNPLIAKSISRIEDSLTEHLTIDDLARSSFISKSHFQRLFYDITGEPVMEYVKKRRLALAALELISSSSRIIDIAVKYGYGSNEAFSRAFKLCYCVSPSEYRKGVSLKQKKEEYCMSTQTNLSLSENASTKLFENIRKASGQTDDFIERAGAIISGIESAVNDDDYRAFPFSVIAGELNCIRNSAMQLKVSLTESIDKKTGSFIFTNCIHAADRLQTIVKNFDDLAFSMNILSFSSAIEAYRMGDHAEPVYMAFAKDVFKLTSDFYGSKAGIPDIAQDAIHFIELDLKTEASNRASEICNLIFELIKDGKRVTETISAENLNGVFGSITNEFNQILCGLSSDSQHVRDYIAEPGKCGVEPNKLQQLTNSVIEDLGDAKYLFNSLVFGAKIECGRYGDNEGARAASVEFSELSAKLNTICPTAAEIFGRLTEICKTADSLKSYTNKSAQVVKLKFMSDVRFQVKIISLHYDLEAKRIHAITTVYDEISQKIVNALNDFSKEYASLAAECEDFDNSYTRAMSGMCDKVSEISALIESEIAKDTHRSKVFKIFAGELSGLSNRIKQLLKE